MFTPTRIRRGFLILAAASLGASTVAAADDRVRRDPPTGPIGHRQP